MHLCTRTYAQTVCTHARTHAPTYVFALRCVALLYFACALACVAWRCFTLLACALAHAHMHTCLHVFALRCVALLYFACTLACWLASLRCFALLRFHATSLAYDRLLSFLCEQAMLCDNSRLSWHAKSHNKLNPDHACSHPKAATQSKQLNPDHVETATQQRNLQPHLPPPYKSEHPPAKRATTLCETSSSRSPCIHRGFVLDNERISLIFWTKYMNITTSLRRRGDRQASQQPSFGQAPSLGKPLGSGGGEALFAHQVRAEVAAAIASPSCLHWSTGSVGVNG